MRASVKRGVDAAGARRRREENVIELRKAKRDGQLQQKRRALAGADAESGGGGAGGGAPDAEADAAAARQALRDLPALAAGLASPDAGRRLDAARGLRKLLSADREPPIAEVVAAGAVPGLVTLLRADPSPDARLEAAWALTNLASGATEAAAAVAAAGGGAALAAAIAEAGAGAELREQAAWGVGNLAGDSVALRDHLLGLGVLRTLAAQVSEDAPLGVLRTAAWALCNLCRGRPAPDLSVTREALPALALLARCPDEQAAADACWALAHLSEGAPPRAEALLASGVCPRLVELLLHPSPAVVLPALRALGNATTGDERHTQAVIDCGALPLLGLLLGDGQSKRVRREAAWTLSNVAAGSKAQIQAVLDAGLLPPLVALMQGGEFEVRKEAAWAVTNAACGGAPEQLHALVKAGAIRPLCELLGSVDTTTAAVALEGLEAILAAGDAAGRAARGGSNPYAALVEDAEGVERLEALQEHSNQILYERAVAVLEAYFGAEEEEAGGGGAGGTYAFGGAAAAAPPPGGGFSFGGGGSGGSGGSGGGSGGGSALPAGSMVL